VHVMERYVAMTEHIRQPAMIAVDGSDALTQRRRPLRGIVRLLGYTARPSETSVRVHGVIS
jgi:hypothetical protein